MASENGSPDPYAVVLADLRAQRDKIDNAIAALEGIRGNAVGSASFSPLSVSATATVETALDESAFLGMTIPEAAIKALKIKRRKLGNAEMVSALRAGGLEMSSADPINTVGSVLTRRADKVGDIVKVGRGVWGLKEWYPNRSFRRPGEQPLTAGASPEPISSEAQQASDAPEQSEASKLLD